MHACLAVCSLIGSFPVILFLTEETVLRNGGVNRTQVTLFKRAGSRESGIMNTGKLCAVTARNTYSQASIECYSNKLPLQPYRLTQWVI